MRDFFRRPLPRVVVFLAVCLLLLGYLVPEINVFRSKPADAATPTLCDKVVGAVPTFFSDGVGGNRLGLPLSGANPDELKVSQHHDRCLSPTKTVNDEMNANKNYISADASLVRTKEFLDGAAGRLKWLQAIEAIEKHEATAVITTTATMDGPHQTTYVKREGDLPKIFTGDTDTPSFQVLRFVFADGHQDNYKLDCGGQAVEQEMKGSTPLPKSPEATPSSPGSPGMPSTPGTSGGGCRGPSCSPPPSCRRNCTPVTTTPGGKPCNRAVCGVQGGAPVQQGVIDHGGQGQAPHNPDASAPNGTGYNPGPGGAPAGNGAGDPGHQVSGNTPVQGGSGSSTPAVGDATGKPPD